ncbi:hypothetical protein HYY71_00895 [Candidatus Woesearchaeota archaeon]|nr:hypothetical protein [Candidatus Woesearchaeota archaeon]
MSKKSQAALEFLMTYGWAILVVLVAVGALAYFGVLSPDKFLPAKCILQPGIACLDHKATLTSLVVRAQNSGGYDLTVNNVKATGCTCQSNPIAGDCTLLSIGTTLANGGAATYTLTCANLGLSKYNGQFNITYTTSIDLGGIQHTNVGQITTRIE